VVLAAFVFGGDAYGIYQLGRKKIPIRIPVPGLIWLQYAGHEAKAGWRDALGRR
jgi:hypothetical protein